MAANVVDQVRRINQLCDGMLASHTELLARKNIRAKRELIQIIKVDLDKLAHAMLEVKERRPEAVLSDFLGESLAAHPGILGRLAEDRIYHVGFEVHEPMDLVLFGIDHWIHQAKLALGVEMRVKSFMRFPASAAFQQRVAAYTEIMRIWLEVNERTLMLELFDIHRPVDDKITAGLVEITHRNFDGLFLDPVPGHERRMARLFGADAIWHYALHVKTPADVLDLQSEFEALAGSNTEYFLPYTAPVHNQHDHSFHTKIVRRANAAGRRMELEFVTEYHPA